MSTTMKDKKYIFGLGTGRCGTVSLTSLLNLQDSSCFSHEMGSKPYLSWEKERLKIFNHLNLLIRNDKKFSGDVAFFLLPYVEDIIKFLPNSKFIILQRDKESTINSYMKKTINRNHWMDHDGRKWRKNIWDRCYPKFSCNSKEEALEKYYDLYYDECKMIPQDKCFWMETSELNDENTCLNMLEWCGFEEPQYIKFKKNKGSNG